MAETPKDVLKRYKAGQVINHRDWNAILSGIKQELVADLGVADSSGSAINSISKAKPFEVNFYTDIDIPAYSVFGISSGQPAVEPVKVNLQSAGVNMMYFTNGSQPFFAGGQGLAVPIGYFQPVKINCADELRVGDLCGPKPNSLKIASGYVGFTCLGLSDSDNHYWVIKSHDTSYLGRVTKRFNPFKPATKKLGEGKVEIYTRGSSIEGSASSVSASGSSGNAVKLYPTGIRKEAFSECEIGINVGEWVKLIPVNGVGLVAQPHAMASSSSSSSGACSFEDLDLWVCMCGNNVPTIYDPTTDQHVALNIPTDDCCGGLGHVYIGRTEGQVLVRDFSGAGPPIVGTKFTVPRWKDFCSDTCLTITANCDPANGTTEVKIGSSEVICACDTGSQSDSGSGSGSTSCVDYIDVVTGVERVGDNLKITRHRLRYDKLRNCLTRETLEVKYVELCCIGSESAGGSPPPTSAGGSIGPGSAPP